MPILGYISNGDPDWIRTNDTRFRKPVLYPLSYEAIENVSCAHEHEHEHARMSTHKLVAIVPALIQNAKTNPEGYTKKTAPLIKQCSPTTHALFTRKELLDASKE